MIHYIEDEPIYHTDEYDVILVPMNIMYNFSDGFLFRLKNKYPEVEDADATTGFGDYRKLGKRVNVGKICLMYVFRPTKDFKREIMDFEALENAMKMINNEFYGKKVMVSNIYGTAFVKKRSNLEVKRILEENNSKIDLYVYTVREKGKVYERKSIERQFKGDEEKIESELKRRFLK